MFQMYAIRLYRLLIDNRKFRYFFLFENKLDEEDEDF